MLSWERGGWHIFKGSHFKKRKPLPWYLIHAQRNRHIKKLFSWYFPHPEVVYFFIWPMIDISHPPRSQQERKGPEEDVKRWIAQKPLKRKAKDRLRTWKEERSLHTTIFYTTFLSDFLKGVGEYVTHITFEFYVCNSWKRLFLPFAPVLASTSNCCRIWKPQEQALWGELGGHRATCTILTWDNKWSVRVATKRSTAQRQIQLLGQGLRHKIQSLKGLNVKLLFIRFKKQSRSCLALHALKDRFVLVLFVLIK